VIESYRLFNCNRCHVQVHICRRCDRGNIYCRPCAPEARKESVRRAGAEYQRKERGRENHAARQQRYLDNKERDHAVEQHRCVDCKEMTHQGSPVADETPQLPAPQPEVPATSVLRRENANVQHQLQLSNEETEESDVVLCDFCGQFCAPYARLDFLRTRRRRTAPRDSNIDATVFT